MALKLENNLKAIQFHLENLREDAETALEKVAIEELNDNTQDGLVPILTSALRLSGFTNSHFQDILQKKNQEKALLIWNTPYARQKFYEGSRSGVAFWTKVNLAKNKEKYRKMIIDELKRR